MNILIVEPYYTGSHKQWIDGYKKYSNHKIKILSLKGQFWKWRMHGGAITLAKKFNNLNWKTDKIIVSDMLDLTTFLALTRKKTSHIPTSIYFHENQISYPWSPKDRDVKKNRDSHYGFINFSSAMAADNIFFNSRFHMDSFYKDLKPFLKNFPDHNEIDSIQILKEKSQVLHIGLDLKTLDTETFLHNQIPNILWNHRWEYDKNPEKFFKVLKKIKRNGFKFNLIILGRKFATEPEIFKQSKIIFKNEIIHWGYLKSLDQYAKNLWKADIIPVTSKQEFFGVSVMEAMYCKTWPILPKKLTYPELIPERFHPTNLYETDDDFYNKIIFAIKNHKMLNKMYFRNIAKEFEWSKIVSLYDKVFEGTFIE